MGSEQTNRVRLELKQYETVLNYIFSGIIICHWFSRHDALL